MLISQSGTNDPTTIVLENTLGVTPSFSYTTPGVYTLGLNGAYVSGKTGLFISPSGNSNDFTKTASITYQFNGFDGFILRTFDESGIAINDGFTNTLIEIRVYN